MFDLLPTMDQLSDAMVATDANDRIVYANAPLERLLGYPGGSLVGREVLELLPVGFREVLDASRADRHLLGRGIHLPATRRDGGELDVEIVLSVVDTREHGRVILASLREVGSRLALERWMVADRSLLAQYEVMTILARSGSLKSVAPEVLQRICESLGWAVGLYWEPDVARGALTLSSWWAAPNSGMEGFGEASRVVALAPGEGLPGQAWISRWLSASRSPSDGKVYGVRRAALPEGVTGALAVPVVWGRKVYGVLEFLARAETPPTDELLQSMAMLGLQIGQFMERVGLEAEANEKARWLSTTLRSIGDAVIATDLFGRVVFMNPVAEGLTGFLGPDVEKVPLESVFRVLHPQTRQPVATPVARVLRDREVVTLSKDVLLVAKDGSERLIEHSAAPIAAESGELQGVVMVFRDTTDKVRTETELARLLMSEQVARAAADYQRELSAFLDDANTVLGQSLEARTTLDGLTALVVPRLAEVCVVHLEGGRTGIPSERAIRGTDPEQVDLLVRCQREGQERSVPLGVAALLDPRGRLSRIEDPSAVWAKSVKDPEHRAHLEALGLSTVITVPLRARGETLGWMAVASVGEDRRLLAKDEELFHELGQRASQALDNVRLYREAQEAVRVRDDFLSIASHELRTPLTPLQLQVQALMREIRDPARNVTAERMAGKLEIVSRQVVRLERLVTSLLDISRITGRRLSLELEDVDLVEVVTELVGRTDEQARQVGSEVVVHAPARVVGHWDRLRLEQVVTNLLSNAIKFGAGKPIHVRVEADQDEARLRVVDLGIGIPPADQARIFERFERAVAMRHFGGFGLGLWIVRQLVEAMGGSVRVESLSGVGSTFHVALPRHPPAAQKKE